MKNVTASAQAVGYAPESGNNGAIEIPADQISGDMTFSAAAGAFWQVDLG